MANFRIGQRVRVLATIRSPWTDEGTVIAVGKSYDDDSPACWVKCDKVDSYKPKWRRIWCVSITDLQPLTDPAADAFLERVKSWKPEPAPVALPVVSLSK